MEKEAYDFLKKRECRPDNCRYSDASHDRAGSAGSDTKRKSIECIFCHIKRIWRISSMQEGRFKMNVRIIFLKPVDRDMLLKLLNRVSAMRDEDDRMRQKNNKMEKAYLARNQIALIKGKYDDSNLQYVTSQMKCKEGVRYVEISDGGM